MKRWNARSIEQSLARQLEAGEYQIGTALPSRTILAKRFGVARATIDNAVRNLANRGMIKSRRGAGSIVINTSRIYNIAIIGNTKNGENTKPRNDVSITLLEIKSLSTASEREHLQNFDGIIWNMPAKQQLNWAESLQDRLPQIIVNRTPDALNFVSTDHTGAIYQITNERLDTHPSWLPVFLTTSNSVPSDAVHLRQEGFIQACRQHNVFYEIINMPLGFEEKLQVLRDEFDTKPKSPLIIVSGALENTGAIITWAKETDRCWRKEILYSDFDNDLDKNMWGVTVTSFLQDYTKMQDLAITSLINIIRKEKQHINILQPPLRRSGDT